jgi:hypothetical protein
MDRENPLPPSLGGILGVAFPTGPRRSRFFPKLVLGRVLILTHFSA